MTDDTDQSAPGADKDAVPEPEKGERIAKRLARAGVCSRRDAEKLIADGRVSVNRKKLTTPAVLVVEGDVVTVDGQTIGEPERARLWRYHKPAGLVTTHKDPQGRPTVFERLPDDMPRVVSIGRLDLNSEGLLLLTNDGSLARTLELPATGWVRRYRVRVFGEVSPEILAGLENGITVEGVRYGPIKAVLDRQQRSNAWLTISLQEGKNREIRRVMEHLGWRVTRLIRLAYGPFQLGHLEPGEIDEVPGKVFREQLGLGKPPSEGKAVADKAQADKRPRDRDGHGAPSRPPGKPSSPKPSTPRPGRSDPTKPEGAKRGGVKPGGARNATRRRPA